jgi:hypothetical protein
MLPGIISGCPKMYTFLHIEKNSEKSEKISEKVLTNSDISDIMSTSSDIPEYRT